MPFSRSLAAVLLGAGLCLALPAAAADSVLTVTGRGMAAAPATQARITGSADGRGATTAEAVAAHHATVERITKALAKAGVPEKDLQVTGMNLNPQYVGPILPGQPRTVTSYNFNTTISVTVENPAKLDEVLQALAEAGVNQAERVNFVTGDAEAAMAEARAAAVKDAFARGKVLAGQTGVTLGRVVAVTDGIPANGLFNYAEQMLAALGNGGAIHNVTATVTVSWEIK
jgi:uncharacterized protein YggE